MRVGPLTSLLEPQLALFVGISYKVVVQLRLTLGKMFERHLGSFAESGSVGSSRGSTW